MSKQTFVEIFEIFVGFHNEVIEFLVSDFVRLFGQFWQVLSQVFRADHIFPNSFVSFLVSPKHFGVTQTDICVRFFGTVVEFRWVTESWVVWITRNRRISISLKNCCSLKKFLTQNMVQMKNFLSRAFNF